ncbi:uncharacterized protein RCC_03754 [Ramularia collo-cygni]|uniref:RING-type domain-containing protein n=1 Tax=Ramularia collo-cygni TaxID=112498 RepID=A0A2D3UZS6_9PEZI|nr:uncharacterized protein RCC_03754 [Ramularia collo-cygni]CZT17917.1 uncharacterized protein RCC_03754 [Ramularia collo-cygni]
MSTTCFVPQREALLPLISSLQPHSGDLVLIQHAPRVPQGDTLCELLVVGTHWQSDLDLFVLPSEDWVVFEKNKISARLQSRATLRPPHIIHPTPRNRNIDAGATVTLRPPNKLIIDNFFDAHCPYQRCHHGVVLINDITFSDLDLMESSRGGSLTLCPFCMGGELLQQHESLVKDVVDAFVRRSATEELLRDSAIREHRDNVNNMRLAMGYGILPNDPGLYGLGVQPGDNADDFEIVSLVEYLDRVGAVDAGSPAVAAPLPAAQMDYSLTRTATRHGRLASAPRGRAGRGSHGNVAYRRLGRDPRPGSDRTHEVSLGDALAEATMRIQDYHDSIMEPSPRLTLQIGNGTTAALDITEEDVTTSPNTVIAAFDATELIVQRSGPGTPRPPPIPERSPAPYRNVICSQPFRWYELVQDRVHNDVCGICIESFAESYSLLITALPCGHFFHDDCIRGRPRERLIVTCPYRCTGTVRL